MLYSSVNDCVGRMDNYQNDRQWALAVVGRAMTRLRQHYAAKGQAAHFAALQEFLAHGPIDGEYQRIARRLAIKPQAVEVAVSRLREDYRELLCDELRRAVEGNDQEL